MSGNQHDIASARHRKARVIEVAPITRAVRVALAASALVFAGTGTALAGTCTAPDADNTVRCSGDFTDTITFPDADLTLVVGDGSPSSVTPAAGDPGIEATWPGAISVTSDADITTVDADAIHAYGDSTVEVINNGTIDVSSVDNDVIGVYGYSTAGTVTIGNTGSITVASTNGLADGMFGSGTTVDADNAGTIDASGYSWAAGIEAQGSDGTTVHNSGSITATASDYGYGWGIYATGGDAGIAIDTTDGSSITVQGGSAVGIRAYDTGSGGIVIDNAGDIDATGALYATGISAATNVDGSNVTVANSGDINAVSGYYATGIEVVTTGAGASGSITNSGNVYVTTSQKYAATGLVVSSDGDATIDNSGTVTVAYGSFSYGALASSFAGDASVTNSGDITVTGGPIAGYGGGYGIMAVAQNGTASAVNTGNISVYGGLSVGMDVSGAAGASATNGGTISVSDPTTKYAFGIRAASSQGDTVVSNTGTVSTTGKYSYSVLATAAQGDVSISNAGDVITDATTAGIGVVGVATAGNVGIDNTGSITAVASDYASIMIGVYGHAAAGDVTVTNSGQIAAGNVYDTFGVFANAGDAAGIGNTGTVEVSSVYGDAIGLYATSTDGTATLSNSGTITATSTYGLADGMFGTGVDVAAGNTGTITATGYGWAAGIEAQGSNGTTVSNGGTITATAAPGDPIFDPYGYGIVLGFENGGAAYGIYATGGDGGITISTADGSSITASGAYATGIRAYGSGAGDVTVANGGDIAATGYYAFGIRANTNVEGADIGISNAGDITSYGTFAATGIEVVTTGTGASGSVSNSGDIVVYSSGYYGAGTGIVVTADGDASIGNSGNITVGGYYGPNYGALALAFAGDANVVNSGAITVYGGYGIVSSSQNGNANVTNSGDVTVLGGPFGIQASGSTGSTIANSGNVSVSGGKYNFAVQATSSLGDVAVDNSGTITAGDAEGGDKYTFGVIARATQGDAAVNNSGSITSTGKYSYAVESVADLGDATITNTGEITANSDDLVAIGAFAVALGGGDANIQNGGDIFANAGLYATTAIAAYGRSDLGNVAITNGGDIAATNTYYSATGVRAAAAQGDVAITNSGNISATATGADGTDYYGAPIVVTAIGVDASAYGAITITNSGTISATDSDRAVAVNLDGPTSTLNNSGTLSTVATNEGRIAVQGGEGAETINNTGKIYGAVFTNGGIDTFANGEGGLWDPGNAATDFGAGDDAITNAAGGTIRLADASIALGSGDNRFENSGTIKVEGDSSIDMGNGPDEGEAETFVPVAMAVPSLNATPLLNDGVIDFLDGAPDDMLTITGDLGGSGALNLDMSTLNGTSDTLYVDGSIASGAAQTVNVALPAGTLTAAALGSAPIEFAQVSGDSTAGSFVGGSVVGYSPRDFLTLGVHITSNIDASNATNDTFSAQIAADGLNANGVLAASIAQGAQSLMSSQIGTWRQRMGVVPPPGSSKNGLSAWVRVFRDDGAIDPGHSARNFGDGGDFGFDQTNSGTEVGLNFEPTPGINLGVTLSKADGKQDLQTAGAGSDKIQANTIGLYGTWIAQNGFYVDASYRGMGFDAKLRTADNTQKVKGHAGAINLETGYAWELGNGLRLEPQFQYTWTTVDKVFQQGDQAYFRSDDSDWQRARVGLAVWKPIESGSGLVWTPYGALSAVRVWDGKVGYTINDAFYGSTDTSGTSALAELGLGLRKNGFSATVGANWTDGGALDSFVGGQVVLRYSW
jgi:outer membrane autotransporter protein